MFCALLFGGCGSLLVHYEIRDLLARVDQVSSSTCGCSLSSVDLGACPCGYMAFNGEFDPGSGRTLAACLTHASRTERPACGYSSGERVSNTWATCPQLRDNTWKQVLIPDNNFASHGVWFKVFRLRMGP